MLVKKRYAALLRDTSSKQTQLPQGFDRERHPDSVVMAPVDYCISLMWQARPAFTSGLSRAAVLDELVAPGCGASDGGLAGLQLEPRLDFL